MANVLYQSLQSSKGSHKLEFTESSMGVKASKSPPSGPWGQLHPRQVFFLPPNDMQSNLEDMTLYHQKSFTSENY